MGTAKVSLYDCTLSSDEDELPAAVNRPADPAQSHPERADLSDSEEGTSDEDVKMLPPAKRQALMARPSFQARASHRDEVRESSRR